MLAIALGVAARPDQLALSASADGDAQFHAELPFLISSPALEIKTGTRKEGSSWKVSLAWIAQRHPENPSLGIPGSMLGQENTQTLLRDLETSRGRGPPHRVVS